MQCVGILIPRKVALAMFISKSNNLKLEEDKPLRKELKNTEEWKINEGLKIHEQNSTGSLESFCTDAISISEKLCFCLLV